MYPENPEETQVIVGSVNMRYGIFIQHCQDLNLQPVPSQAPAGSFRPQWRNSRVCPCDFCWNSITCDIQSKLCRPRNFTSGMSRASVGMICPRLLTSHPKGNSKSVPRAIRACRLWTDAVHSALPITFLTERKFARNVRVQPHLRLELFYSGGIACLRMPTLLHTASLNLVRLS